MGKTKARAVPWECPRCTLENVPQSSKCVACELPRPVGTGKRQQPGVVADPDGPTQQAASSTQRVLADEALPRAVAKELKSRRNYPVAGATLKIQSDYLDMKDIPAENGLPHAGYLVLRRGEEVCILYVGSEEAGDAGWLYGEVCENNLSIGAAGDRGWFPASTLNPTQPSTAVPAERDSKTNCEQLSPSNSSTASAPSREAAALKPVRQTQRHAQPVQPRQPVVQKPLVQKPVADRTAAPPQATLASAFDVAVVSRLSGGMGQRGRKKVAEHTNDFPALPGHSGSPPSWWDEAEQEEEPASQPQPITKPTRNPPKCEVEATIARHRAVAAAAAAKAQASGKPGRAKGNKSKKVETASSETCPICMEDYSGQRRHAQLPCCGVEMCAQCSERSLRSGRCYFCREEADEFPGLAASAGC